MTPAPEMLLHRRKWRAAGHTDWRECPGTPIGDTRCRHDEHLVVVPKEALRETRIVSVLCDHDSGYAELCADCRAKMFAREREGK